MNLREMASGIATSDKVVAVASTPWEQLEVGPEVEAFAIKLDECLSGGSGARETRHRVLRLVNDYFDYATSQSTALRRALRSQDGAETHAQIRADAADHRNRTRVQTLRRWEQEAQTWDLLRRLLPLRYPAPPEDTPHRKTAGDAGAVSGIWREFLDAEPPAVERLAVLRWLQHSASTDSESINLAGKAAGGELQRLPDHHGWIHTKSSIKLRKRLVGIEGPIDYSDGTMKEVHVMDTGGPLVTQLDPDAVARERRQLQPQDESSEHALWQGCFEHLRRGNSVHIIREWCAERADIWRAIAMSALPLSFPPLGSDDNEGNTERDHGIAGDADTLVLWRRMCLQLCRKGGGGDYERAVYGALAGDLQSVEPICTTWNELMFAHYNSLVRSQLDSYLVRHRATTASAAVSHLFPVSYPTQLHDDTTAFEARLIQTLESNMRVGPEAVLPLRSLQAAIISHDLERHLYDQGVVLSLEANTNPTHPSHLMPKTCELSDDVKRTKHISLSDHVGLRILTHVSFVISILDRLGLPGATTVDQAVRDPNQQQNRENILVGYVSFLRLAGLEDLVPLYCSELREPRVYEVLHSNLIHLTDESTRLRQLDLMRKSALSPLSFVRALPDLVFRSLPPLSPSKFQFRIMEARESSLKYGRSIRTDFLGDEPDHIDHSDDVLIRTLEWQLLVDDAWPGLFAVATRIYKYFLKNGHLNAARSLASRISCVEVVRQRLGDIDEFDPLWQDNPSFWVQQLHATPTLGQLPSDVSANARTLRELESLVRVLDSIETLATLVVMSKQDPTLRRDFWIKVGNEVKTISHNMKPLLKNWLMGGIQDNDHELAAVRDIYLSETVLAYISSLHFAGTSVSRDYLLECMELAALVADSDSDVAANFVRCNKMVELVEAFASCSKALAVITGEARSTQPSTKKMRETGWSRDLWSVERLSVGLAFDP